VTAWLRSRGARVCPVVCFVRPGEVRLAADLVAVPAVIAVRIDQTLEDLEALSLELDGGATYPLRVHRVQAAVVPGAWELVAELVAHPG
jgi:hypothetical protein